MPTNLHENIEKATNNSNLSTGLCAVSLVLFFDFPEVIQTEINSPNFSLSVSESSFDSCLIEKREISK